MTRLHYREWSVLPMRCGTRPAHHRRDASKLREGLWQMNGTQQLTTSDIDPDSWYRTIQAQAAVRWPWGWMCASVLAACSVFVLR